MPDKEATARIKINKLLEAAGWRFFADGSAPANIRLEPSVTIKSSDLDALGDNFETSTKGFVDFLLLDAKGFPLLVLEAKAEDKNPLVGKEQARKYAKSQNCRFVILSNGNLHYFWDLERGSPYVITSFPTPDSVTGYQKVTPNPQRLIEEQVGANYIVRTQRPNYASEAAWQNEAERPGYIQANKLRFLRPYQLKAIHSLQTAVGDGKDRFLFEMATGTGKTLTAAAVIKLFLRSGNVRRVLFLVDRLELEDQAKKAFAAVLSADFQTVIYKENRDDWRRAEIVVTTVQSLLFNNKYQKLFSPTDFDLVISDEAHRSIGGNARAVFDYFIGYKLGLTATPRDYLRRFDSPRPGTRDPREAERRLLLDTYRTFGCENSQPTFRYSLLDGVKEGYLINPTVVDARTEVTTTLLSEEGFVVNFTDDAGEDQQQAFKQREFEKRFFADTTNQLLCKTFLDFRELLFDASLKEGVQQPIKTAFKLFDFFANCEYFEEEFNYDEVLKLPPPKGQGREDGDAGGEGPVIVGGTYEHLGADILASMRVEQITSDGMKIDRMFFEKFEDVIRADDTVAAAVEAGQWDRVIDYVNREVFDKPEEYYTLDKLRKAAAVDRRLTLREILEKVFGLIPRFKSRDELLEEEFSKFVADRVPEPPSAIPAIKTYFKASVTSNRVRDIIDSRQFTDLATNPYFTTHDFRAVPQRYRTLVPEYVKDYVPLNQFAP